jgi:hypothetical protein
MYILKERLFLVASVFAIIAGVFAATLGAIDDDLFMWMTMGIATVLIGVVLLISGYLTPAVAGSGAAKGLSVFLILASIVEIVGTAGLMAGNWAIGPVAFIIGFAICAIVFFVWPFICCQGSKGVRSQVIGVASAHESISIAELSKITGVSEKNARDIVYDAIGKKQLIGKMEGDTFVKSAPSATTVSSSTTTKEREVVRVLVICPYCGAKTEQGIGKCQNCQADL